MNNWITLWQSMQYIAVLTVFIVIWGFAVFGLVVLFIYIIRWIKTKWIQKYGRKKG